MRNNNINDLNSPPTLLSGITTCIVGGGSSAHAVIPFLSENGHRVHLLTRRPRDWNQQIKCEVHNTNTNTNTNNNTNNKHTTISVTTHVGTIERIADTPNDVIPEADVILLCMPVHQYRPALHRLAPFINQSKTVYVGAIYGQGGVNLMVHEIEKLYNLTNVVTFAMGSIPWICRTQEYGARVTNYGGKDVNLVAVSPREEFQRLNRLLLQDLSEKPLGKGAFRLADSFLDLTLSVDNQIIHPARCYGLWLGTNGHGTWPSLAEVPFFYRDFDERSADLLQRLDGDYELIRQAVRQRFPSRNFKYMLSYLELERLNHNSDSVGILQSLKESQQLSQIQTPTVPGPDGLSRRLDSNVRFFTDDIAYGLLIGKWIAEKLQIATPSIDEVIVWAQNVRGEYFITREGYIDTQWCLDQGKHYTGLPESYGVSNIEDMLD